MCHSISVSQYILCGICFTFLSFNHSSHPNSFPQPKIPSQSQRPHTRSPTHRDPDAPMPKVPPTAIALKRSPKLPTIGSQLIHAGSGSDECSLCENAFDLDESAESIQILPCMDDSCESCASTWRMLSSPMCSACYGDFACPKVATAQIPKSPPKLQMTHPSSTPDAQIESLLSVQDKCVVSNRADADVDSDDVAMSDPGSPMKDKGKRNRAVSELSDRDLSEALLLANNRVGTNFNLQEIGFETPLDHQGIGTKTQLADTLTKLCISAASESDGDDTWEESSQEPDADDSSGTTNQQAQDTVQTNSRSCTICHRLFSDASHLRQHMVVHDTGSRKCAVCGRTLSSPFIRRLHEQMHRETDSERVRRLQNQKPRKDRLRAGKRNLAKPRKRDRVQ